MGAQKFQDVHLVIRSFVNALLDQNIGELVMVHDALLVSLIEHLEAKWHVGKFETAKVDFQEFLQSEAIGGGAAVDLNLVHQALVVGFVDDLAVIERQKVLYETIFFRRPVGIASVLCRPQARIHLGMQRRDAEAVAGEVTHSISSLSDVPLLLRLQRRKVFQQTQPLPVLRVVFVQFLGNVPVAAMLFVGQVDVLLRDSGKGGGKVPMQYAPGLKLVPDCIVGAAVDILQHLLDEEMQFLVGNVVEDWTPVVERRTSQFPVLLLCDVCISVRIGWNVSFTGDHCLVEVGV